MQTKAFSENSRVSSVAIFGMDARPVDVEVHLVGGLPDFHIVGLPSAAVREARRRVKSAVMNAQEPWPEMKITVNLAPTDLRKDGSLLDLPIAVGIVAANSKPNDRRRQSVKRFMFLGELSLDGKIRPVRGALAAAIAARERSAEALVVPSDNAAEASLVPGVRVLAASHLTEALAHLSGHLELPEPRTNPNDLLRVPGDHADLADVRGQALARRGLEISAAGRHNLLMVGPPGCGKTMLARRLPGILPPLSVEEALEVTHVWSVAGLLSRERPMVTERPYRAPHHHASPAAVIGGGTPWPRPGEVCLAHNGVLFMDELPLFSSAVLDALRQPLEDGHVTIARRGATLTYPSAVSLIAAANPCPCGRAGQQDELCRCSQARIDSYRARLSGPLVDRIDLFVELSRLSDKELMEMPDSEPSAVVRERVVSAVKTRDQRGTCTDQELLAGMEPAARELLRRALHDRSYSARAFVRSLRVSRTIADLEGSEEIREAHVLEALQFRKPTWQS